MGGRFFDVAGRVGREPCIELVLGLVMSAMVSMSASPTLRRMVRDERRSGVGFIGFL